MLPLSAEHCFHAGNELCPVRRDISWWDREIAGLY
jgi:hypothetical protein